MERGGREERSLQKPLVKMDSVGILGGVNKNSAKTPLDSSLSHLGKKAKGQKEGLGCAGVAPLKVEKTHQITGLQFHLFNKAQKKLICVQR